MAAPIVIGQRFNRWTVIDGPKRRHLHWHWLCLCECGLKRWVYGYSLLRLASTSCGCRTRDRAFTLNRKHGLVGTPAWRSWTQMHRRCLNPKVLGYENYGGRGIGICERWRTFANFHLDMGDRPEGMGLDRINHNGNYEPGNCRWATPLTQNRNRRNTLFIEMGGIRRSLPEWCDLLDLKYRTVYSRLVYLKQPPEKALRVNPPHRRSAARS